MIGDRWSADSHRIKDFLARNQIPYRWLDIERDIDAQKFLTYSKLETPRLPLVLFIFRRGVSVLA